jgi:hypothetical protein
MDYSFPNNLFRLGVLLQIYKKEQVKKDALNKTRLLLIIFLILF